VRVLVSLVLALVSSVSAAEPFWCVLLDTKDVDGHRVQFRYDARALWAKPQWSAGGEGPPLSLEAATNIAMQAALRQSPKATGVSWGDIKLLKNVCDYPGGGVVTWFWDFAVSPVSDPHKERSGELPTILPARDIVILWMAKLCSPRP
jgi:hypothetical protein